MRVTTARRPRSARLRRGLIGLALALLLLVGGAGLLVFEPRPGVTAAKPPDAAAAALTRDLAARMQILVATEAADGHVTVSEAELNAALASAQRVLPGLVGRARIAGDAVTLDLGAEAPLLPAGLWTNLHIGFGASQRGIAVREARLGRLPLPTAVVLPVMRRALDWLLGDGFGAVALDAVAGLRIEPPRATLLLGLAGPERGALFERLRQRVRDAAGATDAHRVHVQLWHLDRAARAGELPASGSFLPYLRHASALAERFASGDGREEMKAALFALTLYCGDEAFGVAIGVELGARMRGAENRCAGTTLGGREDLRRHFVVSAGIFAASTDRAAFGVGELKELLDSNAGGTGFSFDDMAANAAGARFAAAFLASPPADWAAMRARLDGETAVLPPLDGLPSRLSAAEFRARYGDVDSPAYAALVAEIGRRIGGLPLYGKASVD